MQKQSKVVVGFNHNIKHKGKIFHVQTEDSGADNPHIITHLFMGGNILATKKTSYADIIQADNLQSIVRELMEEQHKAMLRNLINGVYDDIDDSGRPVQTPVISPSSTQPFAKSPADSQAPEPPPEQPAPVVETAPPVVEPAAPDSAAEAALENDKKFPVPEPPARTQTAIPVHEAETVLSMPAVKVTGTQIHRPPPPETVPGTKKPTTKVTIRPKEALETPAIPEPPPKIEPTPPKPAAQPQAKKQPQAARQLPPEVVAARRLAERPIPKDTAGPTIFGEDLISEKSLDEVILGYLSGDGEESG